MLPHTLVQFGMLTCFCLNLNPGTVWPCSDLIVTHVLSDLVTSAQLYLAAHYFVQYANKQVFIYLFIWVRCQWTCVCGWGEENNDLHTALQWNKILSICKSKISLVHDETVLWPVKLFLLPFGLVFLYCTRWATCSLIWIQQEDNAIFPTIT